MLSRCQLFHFKQVSIDDMVVHLQKLASVQQVEITEEACFLIARKAEGSLRDALTLFDMLTTYCQGEAITLDKAYEQLDIATDAFFFKLTQAIKQEDLAQALVCLDEAVSRGMDLHHLLISWCEVLRDVLLVQDEKTKSLLHVGTAQQKNYEQAMQDWQQAFVLQVLEGLNTCEQTLYTSRYPRLHVELSLARLCQPSISESAQGVEKKK